MQRDENMIAALKRERATYVAAGKDDRVAQVDEQLRHYGHDPANDAANAVTDETATPKDRATPEQSKQTTAAKPSAPAAAHKRPSGGKD